MWTRADGADAGLVRSGAASRLRIEQVRRDYRADVGIAQQDWMRAVQADYVVGDLVADRVLRIAGVLENVDERPDASVTDEGWPPCDRNLHRQPTEGGGKGDGARVLVDHGRRFLVGCGGEKRYRLAVIGDEDLPERSAEERALRAALAGNEGPVNAAHPGNATNLIRKRALGELIDMRRAGKAGRCDRAADHRRGAEY